MDYFVAFSSVSCGSGNEGKSKYGLDKYEMERICEDRKEYGMNGVEIKWGEIGEVGIILEKMGDNEKVVGGKMKKSMNY
jgi:fatty acid synthase